MGVPFGAYFCILFFGHLLIFAVEIFIFLGFAINSYGFTNAAFNVYSPSFVRFYILWDTHMCIEITNLHDIFCLLIFRSPFFLVIWLFFLKSYERFCWRVFHNNTFRCLSVLLFFSIIFHKRSCCKCSVSLSDSRN